MLPHVNEKPHFRFAALSPQRQRNAIEYLIYCETRKQTPNRSTFKEVTNTRHSQTLYELVKLLTDAGCIRTIDGTWEAMVCTRRGRGVKLPVMPVGNMPDQMLSNLTSLDTAPTYKRWTPDTLRQRREMFPEYGNIGHSDPAPKTEQSSLSSAPFISIEQPALSGIFHDAESDQYIIAHAPGTNPRDALYKLLSDAIRLTFQTIAPADVQAVQAGKVIPFPAAAGVQS